MNRKTWSFYVFGLAMTFLVLSHLLFAATKNSKPVSIGMVALLSAPQRYNSKVIETIGFLNIGSMPENDGLWLNEVDLLNSVYKDSFELILSDEQRKEFTHLNHTYVLIEGVLRSEGAEGTAMNSGTIVRITRLDGWSPYNPTIPRSK